MKYRFSAKIWVIVQSKGVFKHDLEFYKERCSKDYKFLVDEISKARMLFKECICRAENDDPWRSIGSQGVHVPALIEYDGQDDTRVVGKVETFTVAAQGLHTQQHMEAFLRYCDALAQKIANELSVHDDFGVMIFPNFSVERARVYEGDPFEALSLG